MALKPESQKQAATLLRGILIFSGCPEEQIQALVAGLEQLDFKKGKVIIMEQEISKTLYILASGSAGIWRRVGGEKSLVATLRAPDFFGETSMFNDVPATALVKAEEDVRLFGLKRSLFDIVLGKFPSLGPVVQKHIDEIKAARPSLIHPKTEND